jgi:hypothetical protein
MAFGLPIHFLYTNNEDNGISIALKTIAENLTVIPNVEGENA